MKIVTWNVNSIRAREEIVVSWLKEHKPDVLLLQETKVTDDKFPKEPFEELGYNLAIFGQTRLNGVAIFSLHPVGSVSKGLLGDEHDEQARFIEAEIAGRLFSSVYVPNGTKVGSENFAYKLRFYERLQQYCQNLLEREELALLGGDFNAAPDPIDVYDPADCEGDICYHIEERKAYRRLVHSGMVDSLRAIHPEKRSFTWWDLRGGAFERDEGMRIDMLLLTPLLADKLVSVGSDQVARSGKGVSDHIPVWCEIED